MNAIHAQSAAPPYTEWYEYLDTHRDQAIANIIRRIWEEAVEICKPKVLMAPSAMPYEDGQYQHAFQLAWDNNEHHFDIDITSSGGIEWFYRNRKTDEIAGSEDIETGFSDALKERLRLVAR